MTQRRDRIVLVEPEINPVTRRFGLPIIANYPPLAQARLSSRPRVSASSGAGLRDFRCLLVSPANLAAPVSSRAET